MRTATIKHRRIPDWWYSCDRSYLGRATKPDHWKSVTRIKLPTTPKAHKPADSGVHVGNDARRCGFHEV